MSTYDFSSSFATSFSQVGGATGDNTLLDLLKLFLGIPLDDTEHDEELTRALNMAGDAIETYLDRVVAKRETTEHFAHHFGTVELHNMPVDTAEPLTVNLNGVDQTGYETVLYTGRTAYVSRIGHNWDMPMDWRRFDQVTVAYTAGFDPIPSDLAQAIVYTAADIYKSEGTGAVPGGSSGEMKSMTVFDVGAISYDVGSSSSSGGGGWPANDQGLLPDVAVGMLSRYKRMYA